MEIKFDLHWKRLLQIILLVAIVAGPTFIFASSTGYKLGLRTGYTLALDEIAERTGLEFTWTTHPVTGTDVLLIHQEGALVTTATPDVHLTVVQRRLGQIISWSHHPGVLTNIGKDFIEAQLSGTEAADNAKYISCSNDGTSPSAAWTEIPSELDNTNGLGRALGTYVSTGYGAWNVTKTFSVTGTQSVQLYGLQWSSTGESNNNLLCSDTSTQKNCQSGDTLTVTWQCTVS